MSEKIVSKDVIFKFMKDGKITTSCFTISGAESDMENHDYTEDEIKRIIKLQQEIDNAQVFVCTDKRCIPTRPSLWSIKSPKAYGQNCKNLMRAFMGHLGIPCHECSGISGGVWIDTWCLDDDEHRPIHPRRITVKDGRMIRIWTVSIVKLKNPHPKHLEMKYTIYAGEKEVECGGETMTVPIRD